MKRTSFLLLCIPVPRPRVGKKNQKKRTPRSGQIKRDLIKMFNENGILLRIIRFFIVFFFFAPVVYTSKTSKYSYIGAIVSPRIRTRTALRFIIKTTVPVWPAHKLSTRYLLLTFKLNILKSPMRHGNVTNV